MIAARSPVGFAVAVVLARKEGFGLIDFLMDVRKFCQLDQLLSGHAFLGVAITDGGCQIVGEPCRVWHQRL